MGIILTITILINGFASYYDPDWMPIVYNNRIKYQQVQPCPECIDMVAVLDKEMLGHKLWFSLDGQTFYGPMLIVDCAAEADYARLKAKNLVVELSYQMWQQLKLPRDLVPITITYIDPKLWHPNYLIYDSTNVWYQPHF